MAKHDKEFTDSSPLDDIKKANDTKLLGNASFGVFGPNPFGPSVPFGGLQGPSGDFGGSTLSGLGGGTFLNIDFGGLGDAFIADLLDLISFLQSDIEKTGNTESTKPFQNAIDRWTELLNDYQNGDATLEDLKNFDAGVLADMPSWSDYFNDLISGEEGVVLGYPDSTGEGGDEGVILPPLLPPLPTDDDDDGDDDAGGGGGGGGEEGGEAGASDDGGSDDGGGDTGGDDGSTDSGGGNLDQGDGEGEESTPQYYEVDENGNVFIVDGDDEDGFWDENGFWNGAWKRIGNINDGTGAWWEDFESGGIYGEHGELIIRPESDPDPDSDDDDDDDDDTTDLTPDPDLFGGGEPTDPGPPITGGPNPPSVNDGDGEGTLDTDPNTGDPQTGGPQPPGGDGGGGDGTTDDGTNTGGGGDDTGGGGGGSDGGGGGGSGGGNGTGGGDGSGGDGSGGDGDGGDGSGDGSGGDGSGDGLGGDDSAFDPDKRSAYLPFVVPDLYDVPQERGMFLSQIGQPDSSLLLDDFFIRNFNR